jgi:hypothetical protein
MNIQDCSFSNNDQIINEQKLSGEYCDVILKIDVNFIDVRKSILSNYSPVFAEIIKSVFIETQVCEICANNTDYDTTTLVLNFIYEGKCEWELDTIISMRKIPN